MDNNDLQNLWKKVDQKIHPKSTDELNQLLHVKSRQTVNKFLMIITLDIIVCCGMLIYLMITSLNRSEDALYLINNVLLGLIIILVLFSGIYYWHKLRSDRFNYSLNKWLEVRIKILSDILTGKMSRLNMLAIPILYLLTIFSIHVYFENQLFVEVLRNEESIIGLMVGSVIGLSVGYYVVRKIRLYQLEKLEFLKELYAKLETASE